MVSNTGSYVDGQLSGRNINPGTEYIRTIKEMEIPVSNTGTTNFSPEYCQYKLPCGICTKLMMQCLKIPSTYTVCSNLEATHE